MIRTIRAFPDTFARCRSRLAGGDLGWTEKAVDTTMTGHVEVEIEVELFPESEAW